MKKKILVIDDEKSIVRLLDFILKMDYEVLKANSGKEALDIINNHSDIDCIVSDYYMENGDGLFFIKNLKKDIPVIFLTGHGNKDIYRNMANFKAFYIMEKPINEDELIEQIKKACVIKHEKNRLEELATFGEHSRKIIHDMATPLTVLDLTLAKLEKEGDLSKINDYKESTKKAIDKIKFLLELSRNDQKHVSIEEINIRDFLFAYNDIVKDLLEINNVYMTYEFRNDIMIKCNPSKMQIIFDNLIKNSIEAFNDHKIEDRKIHIVVERLDDILISYEDNGPGLNEEIKDLIFKESITTKGKNGTGLGSMNVVNYLKEINGSIKVGSKSGSGVLFLIRIEQ